MLGDADAALDCLDAVLVVIVSWVCASARPGDPLGNLLGFPDCDPLVEELVYLFLEVFLNPFFLLYNFKFFHVLRLVVFVLRGLAIFKKR